MLILVIGGSASGKSALAERYCKCLGGSMLYIATMVPEGGEAMERIERHHRQRAQLGFNTLECYRDLARADLARGYDTALLECLGNLTANEMFADGADRDSTAERVWTGVTALHSRVSNLVLVTNNISGGAEQYKEEMLSYLKALGEINRRAAQMAQVVVEAVCGLPIILKGEVNGLCS